MCNNVIGSTYSSGRKLIGVLTVLGGEVFNVRASVRAGTWEGASVNVRRKLTMVVKWSSHHLLNQGTGRDLAVNTNVRYIPLQLRHRRFGQLALWSLKFNKVKHGLRISLTRHIKEMFLNKALIIHITDDNWQLQADWWHHRSQSDGAILPTETWSFSLYN
jgi:hypothetical protein